MEIYKHAHSVGQNAYHLVWRPKYAHPVFRSQDINKVCEGALRQVAINYGFRIYELRVMSDHVHLFVEVPPTMNVSKVLQLFKGISSRMLRRRFKFLRQYSALWSPGKFFRSVGNVTAQGIDNYIKYSQKEWRHPAEQQSLPAYA